MEGWKTTFVYNWTRCDDYFKTIRESLAKHSDLLARPTTDHDVAEAKAWRANALEQVIKKEREYATTQRQSVMSWLKNGGMQEEELDSQLSRCHPNTCDWLRDSSKASRWLKSGQDHKILWLKGKPGSGKGASICLKYTT